MQTSQGSYRQAPETMGSNADNSLEGAMTNVEDHNPPRVVKGNTGAIVIGSNYGGLGIVRSLGRQGIPVWVLQDDHASAAFSRYARRRLPWPATDEAHQVDYLIQLCIQYGLTNWSIHPTTDESAALVARNEILLRSHYLLTTPPWEVMRWAYDKRLTYRLATDLAIDHPWTFLPQNRAELAALDCPFPAILKPAIKDKINPFTAARAWPVHNDKELLDRYDEACALVDPDTIMVQELIPGGGETQYSFVALCDDGRLLAYGTAQRARQYPVDFGHGSTFVEMVDLPEIEDSSRKLLAKLGYRGLVELEFKYHPVTGQFKLLDINARAWAWHSLGRRSGVDFSYLCWQLLHGEPVAEQRAQPGTRWVRMITDIPAGVTEIRHGRLSPRGYLSSLRPPLEFAVFATDDPLPALVELPSFLNRLWKRDGGARSTLSRSGQYP
jgi:predicted ATP-grasp superfamily ATP-dependent carboligase